MYLTSSGMGRVPYRMVLAFISIAHAIRHDDELAQVESRLHAFRRDSISGTSPLRSSSCILDIHYLAAQTYKVNKPGKIEKKKSERASPPSRPSLTHARPDATQSLIH